MNITAGDLRHRLLPILLSQGFGVACGLGGVMLSSHWVAPADYGTYGVFVSLASVGVTVIYAGVIKFIARHWLQAEDRAALWHAARLSLWRKTPWLVLATVITTAAISPSHPWAFGTLLVVSAVGFGIAQLAQTALQAAREHWKDFGLAAAISVSRSLLPPILYITTSFGHLALLIGFAAQAVVGAALGWLTLNRWKRKSGVTRPPSLTPIYNGPWFVALALTTWLLMGLHRWLSAWFFGAEIAGYFTLAGNIGSVLPVILSSAMMLWLQPTWFGRDYAIKGSREILLREADRSALLYTAGALALSTALHFTMPMLVGRIIGEQYAAAADFIVMTGCASMSIGIGGFFHGMLLALKLERACPHVDLSGAACLIIGAFGSASAGPMWFKSWLMISPVVPWLVNRTLARRAALAMP